MMPQEYVCIDVERVLKFTELAMCVLCNGEKLWIPLSQVSHLDVDQYEVGDEDVSISITEWFASKEGIG